MKKTIHIIEPRLKNLQGHYMSYVLSFSNLAQKNNFKIEVWVDSSIDEKASKLLKQNGIICHPVVEKNIHTQRLPRLFQLMSYAISYFYILSKIKNKSSDSVITFSGEIEYLFGAIIFFAFRKRSIPLTIQFFRWEVGGKKHQPALLYLSLRLLSERLAQYFLKNSNLQIITQTKQLAAHIKERTQLNVLKFPNIIVWKKEYKPLKSINQTPVIGYLGNSRKEKGLKHLLMAFGAIQYEYKAYIQFDLFSSYNHREKKNKELINSIDLNKNIHIVSGYLSDEKYFQLFNKIDIILLPYQPEEYRLRSSGIFSEAIGLGKIIVTHRDTLMGETIEKLQIGVTYKNSEKLSIAINQALVNFSIYKKNIDSLKNEWKQKNNVHNFFKHYESKILKQ